MQGAPAPTPTPASGNTHAYRYYRVLGNGNDGLTWVELELAETNGGADTTSGVTVTATSDIGGTPASAATDDNFTSVFCTDFSGTRQENLKLDYGATAGNWKAINQVKIYGRTTGQNGFMPAAFSFQGSDDNSAWTTLLTVSGLTWAADEVKTWQVP